MASISKYQTSKGETRWRVRYRKPDGTQSDKRGFLKKIDAQRWCAEHITLAQANGSYIDETTAKTRFETVYRSWLARKRISVKPTTLETVSRAGRLHVLPKWGQWPIRDITHSAAQDWVGELVEKGMSPESIKGILYVARSVMASAVEENLIAANPMGKLDKPKPAHRRHHYLNAGQLMELADNCGWRRDIVLTLGLTGMRWGELAALTVGQVNTKTRRIVVDRNRVTINGKASTTTPKNGKHRVISYPRVLDQVIQRHIQGKTVDMPVFTAPQHKDTPLPPSVMAKNSSWLDAALKKTPSIPFHVTVHDLRHTAASLMLQAGANVKVVQRQLGHASAAMTLDVYADLFEDDLDTVGDALSVLVSRTARTMDC